MAAHVNEAGFPLVVWNRTPGKGAELVGQGAVLAESLEELASACDVILTCVTRSEDVAACVQTVLPFARQDIVIVDHSTIAPGVAQGLSQDCLRYGVTMLDAPVTGGSMGASNGTLTAFVGGDEHALDRVRPVLNSYCRRVERLGPSGAGQLAKLANQIAVVGSLIGLCESMSFSTKAGLDTRLMRDLIGSGAGGSWAFENYGEKLIKRDWTPGFSITNQRKDLGYCAEAAKSIDASIPGAQLADRLLGKLENEGHGDWTTVALYELYLSMDFIE